ncbi:hypothetical protein QBC47DRAFT_395411 [Echria macrotheca]|uniref:Clr5 domain-containing protein n=1 Tax=Echria macrotheca TaxID=438768 RepID=A0AAJ0B1B5_9PEZI|nr:hypothetical protein QBC47DRAFT_395411 [Echria macrotheca]
MMPLMENGQPGHPWRLKSEDWEQMRPRLTRMHESMFIPQIRDILKTEGIELTNKQLKDQFKKWKLKKKNFKRADLDRVLDEMSKAGEVIPRTGLVNWQGFQIPAQKLHRREKERTRTCRKQRTVIPESQGQSTPQDALPSSPVPPAAENTEPPKPPPVQPALPALPERNDKDDIDKNIWKIRLFAGYAVWFYDFLRLCCDPELSPVPPNAWGSFMREELAGYELLFLKFIDGSQPATRTARDAVVQLKVALNSAYSGMESDTSSDIGSYASSHAVSDISSKVEADASSSIGSGGSSRTISDDAEDGAESQVLDVRNSYRMLHVISQRHYPSETPNRRQHIRNELDLFQRRMEKMAKSYNKLITRIRTEGRQCLKANARPFRANGGSPAGFCFRLREVVLHAVKEDIFQDPALDFTRFKVLHPGRSRGPSITFIDDAAALPCVAARDPVLFGEADDYDTKSADSLPEA